MDRQLIPLEAQSMIAEFNAAERARATANAENKRENPKGTNLLEKRLLTSAEVESLASRWGLDIETGGKHKHLVSPDGKHICAYPFHGSGENLSTGVTKAVKSFVMKYGEGPDR
jgi:hypothetical protein